MHLLADGGVKKKLESPREILITRPELDAGRNTRRKETLCAEIRFVLDNRKADLWQSRLQYIRITAVIKNAHGLNDILPDIRIKDRAPGLILIRNPPS